MKKLKTLVACTIFLLVTTVLFMTGCYKNVAEPMREEIGATSENIPKVLYNAHCDNLRIPDGTTTEVLNNGSTVRLKFPKGILLVGNTSSGEILREEETEYTCTGDCSEGCDVLYIKNTFGCASCTPATIPCTGKVKPAARITGQGFVNLNAGIHFVKNKKEASFLFAGPDVLFNIPEVREAMKAFNLKIHGAENPDFSDRKQFREVGLNLFGCLVTYMAPGGSNPNASRVEEEELVDAGDWSCRCDDPKGGASRESAGCTAESGFGYKKCVSGECKACTMKVDL